MDLTTDVTVDSDADNDASDGNISFSSTIDATATPTAAGSQSLWLDADSGSVTLTGAAGGTTKLKSLTVSDAGQVDLASVTAKGAISVTGTTNIDLNGSDYKSDDGNITFTGAVDLTTDVSVDSDADNDTSGRRHRVHLDGGSDAATAGSQSLTLDADGGDVTLTGAVGGTTKLESLTVTKAAQVDLASVTSAGAISVRGTTNIELNGSDYKSDDGDITFTGAVDGSTRRRPAPNRCGDLTTDVSVDSDADNDTSDGDIEFTSTIDAETAGTESLTLDADGGDVTLTGAVGGTKKLKSLTVTNAAQVDLASVTSKGAISVTGTNIDLNGSSYRSDDGNITFTGAVDLTTDVTVDSDADNDASDGNISFSSTIDAAAAGSQSLRLDADSGSVTLTGAAGGTTKLKSLTVSKAGQVDLASVTSKGAISVTGTTNIDLNGSDYKSDDGDITFTGAVDLTTDVSVDSDADTDSTDGDIEFTSTIDAETAGTESLTLDADGGSVTLSGAVGGTKKLKSLTVSDAGQVDLASVTAKGAISVTGTTNIDLNGSDYESDDGDITFTGAVDLTTDVSVDSDADTDSTDGDISFSSTIDAATAGSQSLTLDADSGSVTLTGAAGGTKKLKSLTVSDAGQVDLASVTAKGAISVTGTTNIDLNGSSYRSDDGNITFTGAVDLTTDVSVDSDADNDTSDGDISFSSTIDAETAGTESLTLDADGGDVTLTGAVGGTTKLESLTVTKAAQVDLASVTSAGAISVRGTTNIDLNGSDYKSDDGDITFTGAVDLTTDVSVDSDADNDTSDGDISFSSTIDAATAGSQSLTLDADGGSVTLSGAVGGTKKLKSLTVTNAAQVDLASVTSKGAISVTGTNIDLNGSSYRSDDGNITFTGAVDLTTDVSVDSDANDDASDGNISFSSTIDAATAGSQSLRLDADSGSVTLTGAAGGTRKLKSLTVSDAGQVDLASVTAKGAISVTGTTNIDLNGSDYKSDDGNITFTGAVDLTTDVSVDSDADNDTSDGDIEFTSTIDAATAGSQSLTLDADGGDVTLTGAVGGTTKLESLTVTKAAQVDLASVTSAGAISVRGTTNIELNGSDYKSDDGDITFTGAVDLTTDVSVDSDADNDTSDGDIEFTSTIDAETAGTESLTLDADGGDVTLTGAVGGTKKLKSLTVTNAAQVDLASVTSKGAISVTGTNIDLNGSSYRSDDGNITFTGAVDLTTDVTVDSDADNDASDGNISFSSTIDAAAAGSQSLRLDADSGSVTLTGAAGGTTKLKSLTVSKAGQVDLASVASKGVISVTGTNIDLNGSSYRSDDGDITFTGAVDLTTDVSVDSDADTDSTDGDIEFTSTIDAETAGTESLTLDADGGDVTLTGAVGGTTKLESLTVSKAARVDLASVTSAGAISVRGTTNIDLNGSDYKSDDGDITFTGAVDLTTDVSVDSDADNDMSDGDISFSSTIDAETAGTESLTLDADGGDVTLTGAVGGTKKLKSLTVTNAAQVDLASVRSKGAISVTGTNIDLNGSSYRSDDGDITFTGAVDLTTDVSVDSDADNDTSDGDISFSSTIDAATAGSQSLTLDADSGSVTLTGAVGGTKKLKSLTVSKAGQVDLASVTSKGAISVTGTTNIDLNGSDYKSDDGDITFTGAVDLTTDVSVDSDADNDTSDGDISFSSTIDAETAGTESLTLDADGGDVTLTGAVGGTRKLDSLTITGADIILGAISLTGTFTITAGGTTTLNGDITVDDTDVAFNGPVVLGTDVTIDTDGNDDSTDGDITFDSTVNAKTAGSQSLTLDADTGDVTLTGAAGGTKKLKSLTVRKAAQVDLASVTAKGAISVTGTTNIDLNGSDYKSDDGNITFTGAVDLTTDVSVDSDADNDTSDGDISFSSTIDAATAGSQSLTLDADGGDVTLTGAVGGTTKLESLTVTKAAQVDLASVTSAGAISVRGTTNIDLNGSDYKSDDGDITFTGAVDLTTDVSVDSDADNDTSDGDISFSSTIDAATAGSQSLTLDADGGSVTLSGAVGGTKKLKSLTVTNAAQVDLASVTSKGAISVTGTNIDLNGSSYRSDDGNITFTGAVDLTTDVSVDSDANDDASDGNISFSSTIDAATAGSQSLRLDADSGSVTLTGAAGGTRKLKSLTVSDAGQVDLASVTAKGAISVTGTTNIDLNGSDYKSDDGNITFTGAVDLTTDVSVDSDADNDTSDGDISFSSTIDAETAGTESLTLDADGGDVTLTGAVGGTTKLESLTVTKAAQVDLASVTSAGAISVRGTTNIELNGSDYKSDDGDITFTGAVDLTTDVSVDSDADNDTSDGDISFSSTIDAATAGSQSLTLDADRGSVTLSGAVGGTKKLKSLTVTNAAQVDLASVTSKGAISVTGTNIDLNGSSYRSDDGNITFTGAVDLTTDVSVDSDANDDASDGNISFSSTIDAAAAGSQSLRLDADSGSVTLTGAAGGTTKLKSLTVSKAGQVDLASVASKGVISVTGTNIDLNGSSYRSDDGDITFTGAVDLTTDVSVDSDADTDSTDGDIEFTSTIDAETAGTESLTLDADGGDVTLTGAAGGTTKLESLTVSKAARVDLASVTSAGAISVTGTNIDLNGSDYKSDDGDITFTGAVDLTTDVSVDSDADTDSTDGDIEFTSTIDAVTAGFQSLTLDADGGDVALTGAVGGTKKLKSLTVSNAAQVDLALVRSKGSISVTGTNIDLNGSAYRSDDGDITFTGAVDLTTDVSVDSDADTDSTDGDISFTSTIDAATAGSQSLRLDADGGSVTLTGAVGGTNKLKSLNVSKAAQVDLASVAAAGAISVTGTNIDLNGSDYKSDDGDITFTGAVDLTTDVSVDSDADNDTSDGDISFSSTIDAETAGTESLTLDADGGDVTLTGAVGGTRKLDSLTITGADIILGAISLTGTFTITAGGTTTLNGDITVDDTDVAFNGPVVLGTDVTIDTDGNDDSTDGDITFDSTVNAKTAGSQSLTLDADTGDVTLAGAAGGTKKLKSLTVRKAAQVDLASVTAKGAISVTGTTNIDLNGSDYKSDYGDITFTGTVDLTTDVSVDSDADNNFVGGDIEFTSTIDAATAGSQSLTLNAGTGDATLPEAVGGTTKLKSFTVSRAGQVDLAPVAAVGAISVTGTNIDLNGASYKSDDGDISFTGAVDLTTDVTVNSDADDDATDGNISFSSTIDAATAGSQSLTLEADSGSVTVSGTIGGTNKLNSLTVTAGQVDLASVAATGTISVTGTRGIDLIGSSYESDDDNIIFTGPVLLTTNVTVDSDADENATDGNIQFSSTIDGGYSLTLDADTGNVTVSGAIGGRIKLVDLSVKGDVVSVSSIALTGAPNLDARTRLDLNGSLTTDGAPITFKSKVVLGKDVTINTDGDNDGTGGSITFHSPIDGDYSLTLNSGNAPIKLDAPVGEETKLKTLTLKGGRVDLNSVRTVGGIVVTGTAVRLNGTHYKSDDGKIIFSGPVEIAVDMEIDSDADNDPAGGNIVFASTLDGNHDLTLNAGNGNIGFLGDVGAAGPVGTVTIGTANNITLGPGVTMNVASFEQTTGSGTTDFGYDSLHSVGPVNITTRDIRGRIVAPELVMTADNSIAIDVNVGELTIVSARTAKITGAVGGGTGRHGANLITIVRRGSGSFRFDGFGVLGAGDPSEVIHAELAALPHPQTSRPARRLHRCGWSTPGEAVYTGLIPTLRASVGGAVDGPYAINVYREPFGLLSRRDDAEAVPGRLPRAIENLWWYLDARPGACPSNPSLQENAEPA